MKFKFVGVWLLVSVFSSSIFAQGFPELGKAKASDVDNQAVSSESTFSGGFSVDGGVFSNEQNIDTDKSVKIAGEINVDPNDLGKTVDIVVYVSYALLDTPAEPEILSLGSGGAKPWNYDLSGLLDNPFEASVELQATHQVEIYNGPLPEGRLLVYFGYVSDTALVVNQKAIEMIIEDSSSLAKKDKEAASKQQIDLTPSAHLPPPPPPPPDPDGRLGGEESKLWPNGSTLKIGFNFEGIDISKARICNSKTISCDETALANKIVEFASEWSKYGNIYFTKSSWNEADIRITLVGNGSYSYIGTDAKGRPNQTTMNLSPVFWHSLEDMKAVVVHEFGHGIGVHHEHNSPAVSYNWQEDYIISSVMSSHGWSEEAVRSNIIDSVLAGGKAKTAFIYTDFDSRSIMIYPILKGWVSAEDQANPVLCPDASASDYYCVIPSTDLTRLDQEVVAMLYLARNQQGGETPDNPVTTSNNGCAMGYDAPSQHIGSNLGFLEFHNTKNSPITVNLHSAYGAFEWSVEKRTIEYIFVIDFYGVNAIGPDWGVQVNNSPICKLSAVSAFDTGFGMFTMSITNMPGQ